jgi:chorismate synthase
VLPRAVPIVEAMTALVLVDHALRHTAQCGTPADKGAIKSG